MCSLCPPPSSVLPPVFCLTLPALSLHSYLRCLLPALLHRSSPSLWCSHNPIQNSAPPARALTQLLCSHSSSAARKPLLQTLKCLLVYPALISELPLLLLRETGWTRDVAAHRLMSASALSQKLLSIKWFGDWNICHTNGVWVNWHYLVWRCLREVLISVHTWQETVQKVNLDFSHS